jgi:hypothetical protein
MEKSVKTKKSTELAYLFVFDAFMYENKIKIAEKHGERLLGLSSLKGYKLIFGEFPTIVKTNNQKDEVLGITLRIRSEHITTHSILAGVPSKAIKRTVSVYVPNLGEMIDDVTVIYGKLSKTYISPNATHYNLLRKAMKSHSFPNTYIQQTTYAYINSQKTFTKYKGAQQ